MNMFQIKNQWKSIIKYWKCENRLAWLEIYETRWTSMKIDKWHMIININQLKWITTNEQQYKSMKMHQHYENYTKSIQNHEHPWT